MNDMGGAVTLAIAFIVISSTIMIMYITQLPVIVLIARACKFLLKGVYRHIDKSESKYKREREIGKINSKNKRVKLYRFMSELVVDLGLSDYRIRPYELLTITTILCTLLGIVVSRVLFGVFWMSIIIVPMTIVTTFCVMYTKANIAHDERIEAVLEAENIISNNIKNGVRAAVRENLTVIPKQVRPDFEDFLDNIEYKKYHIRTALLELNNRLGSIADDFIKKCISFELDERAGEIGVFNDVVVINNIKMEMRRDEKRKFSKAIREFKIGASMIVLFLALLLIIYPSIRRMYFSTIIGKFIILVDIILVIAEYIYVTYLKAKEI